MIIQRNDQPMQHPPRRCGQRQRVRGFSLMEVLVTVLILAIGLLGLAGLQGASIQANHSANLRTQATYLAYEIVDAMRANPTQTAAGNYLVAYGTMAFGADVASIDLAAWRSRVQGLLPAGGSEIILDANGIYVVSVRWDDIRAGAANVGDYQVFTLEVQP